MVLLTLASTAWPGRQVCALANGDRREPRQKWKGGHASHVPLVTLPNVPGVHATSHADEFAALNALQSQRVQGSVLVPFLNWPAGQVLQVEPPNAEDPGGQSAPAPPALHSDLSPAPASKFGLSDAQSDGCGEHDAALARANKPIVQVLQATAPALSWNWPAGQPKQETASGAAYEPGSQAVHLT